MCSRTLFQGQAPSCTLPTSTSLENQVLSANGKGGSAWTGDLVVASLDCPAINSTNITATDTVAADVVSATTAVTCAGQITTLDLLQAPRGVRRNFGAVTQSTTITTPVTLTTLQGIITTATTTLAAGASASFTLSSANINSEVVRVFVSNYTGTYGTQGWPIAHSYTSAPASAVITVTNIHPTEALAGELTIVYEVLQSIQTP